jgi:hypothetical protein
VILKGSDQSLKDQALRSLTQTHLAQGSEAFDLDIMSVHRRHPDEFRKSLLTLPVMSSKRVVVMRGCDKLSAVQREKCLALLDAPMDHVVWVLDWMRPDGKQAFYKKAVKLARVVDCGVEQPSNVFDMTKLMARGQAKDALKVLTALMADGQHPLQIMGGLVWFWGKQKVRLTPGQFQKGMNALQDTDLHIKRSRMRPDHAMEVLVVRLTQIINGESLTMV